MSVSIAQGVVAVEPKQIVAGAGVIVVEDSDSTTISVSENINHIVLAAGTTTQAPLTFTTQPNGLTTFVQGAMELIGNSLQFINLAKRRSVVQATGVRTTNLTVANTLIETTLISSSYGANYLEVGKSEEIIVRGVIGKANSNTLTLRMTYAGVTIITLPITGAAITSGTAFEVLAVSTCRGVGPTGTLQVNLLTRIDGITNPPDTRATVTVNTTIAQNLTLTAQWGTASVSNTLTVDHGRVLCIDGDK